MAEIAMTTLEKIGVKRKSLEDYRRIVGDELIDEISLIAAQLKGTRLRLSPLPVGAGSEYETIF